MDNTERTQKPATSESAKVKEKPVITSDWTESEWFEVWLKLARREFEPAKGGH